MDQNPMPTNPYQNGNSFNRPDPSQPIPANQFSPSPAPKNSSSKITTIFLLIVALFGLGFGIYEMLQVQAKDKELKAKDEEIQAKNEEINRLNNQSSSEKDKQTDTDEAARIFIQTKNNTTRKNDIGTLIASLTNYESSNRGNLPDATWAGTVPGIADISDSTSIQQYRSHSNKWYRFYANYILTGSQAFLDPDGSAYNLRVTQCDGKKEGDYCSPDSQVQNLKFSGTESEEQSHTAQNHNIHIVVNATCNEKMAIQANNSRSFAVLYKLEGDDSYCETN